MILFSSTYTNKVDQKGRVSVPASFRSEVKKRNDTTDIWMRVPYGKNYIECLDATGMQRVSENIRKTENKNQREAAYSLYIGTAEQVACDDSGRIVIPKAIIEKVGIVESAVFEGLGSKFHIYSESAHAKKTKSTNEVVEASHEGWDFDE